MASMINLWLTFAENFLEIKSYADESCLGDSEWLVGRPAGSWSWAEQSSTNADTRKSGEVTFHTRQNSLPKSKANSSVDNFIAEASMNKALACNFWPSVLQCRWWAQSKLVCLKYPFRCNSVLLHYKFSVNVCRMRQTRQCVALQTW